jgi:Tat protein secretion system quality control protein TatD with DNase activity
MEECLSSDPRVRQAIYKEQMDNHSFLEKENFLTLFFGGIKYSQEECRKAWFQAMAIGMEKGLEMASLEGQKIDLYHNCNDPRQKEFLDKFYELAKEYNCAIVYHPNEGLIVMDLNR